MIKKILENGFKRVDKDKENLKNDNSKNGYEDINKYIIIIISFSIISYLLITAKIVPFLSIRYFLLIVPSIYILITYIFKFVMETLVKNIYFSEIDKLEEKDNKSIEEIRKKEKINLFLHNNDLDKIDKILKRLNGEYKVIKENKTFYGKMYLLSR